jgi:hypothetical protein
MAGPILGFNASPHVLIALFAMGMLFTDGFHPNHGNRWIPIKGIKPTMNTLAQFAYQFARAIIILMFFWLCYRGGDFLYQNRLSLTFEERHGGMVGNAGHVRELTCHRPEARLLVYPLNPSYYFFSHIPPASRYTFMTPWVAKVGLRQAIHDLESQPVLVVLHDEDVWGYPVREYMKDFLRYLDEHYTIIDRSDFSYYMSPELEKICPVDERVG